MPRVFASDHPHDLPLPELALLIGGKAAGIATMASGLGLPVPPAFTITTATCNEFLAGGWPDGLDAEIREHMARLEARVGRRFGDPVDPLLVSVRSGAPRSMPGMMDTILNLGLNPDTEAGLAAASGNAVFAADCRERFERIYRDVVGVAEVPADPWAQLRGAIEAVFRSWNSDRARAFRERERISDDLGTGVTVQAMVFGNRGEDSATGVLFTRDAATGERAPYGDVMFNAQGEDVVAGTHATEPISCLDDRLPAVATELRRYARILEHHYRDCCDIEFTIEQGRLWMLQTRIGKLSPRAALRVAIDMAEDPDFPLSREEAVRRVAAHLADPPRAVTERADAGPPLATGLAASPGVACGEIRLTPDAAVEAAGAGRDVILVRRETSPDDVHGMSHSQGILTTTGGLVSHAAVVARGWGIPAVVGASGVLIGEGSVTIGDRTFPAGAVITIDGGTGEVFEGAAAGVASIVPEVAILVGWARELGIEVAAPGEAGVGDGAGAGGDAGTKEAQMAHESTGAGAGDDTIRALAIKGYADAAGLAAALGCPPEDAAGLLDQLVAEGLAEPSAGTFRLTSNGKTAADACLAADRDTLGIERANHALDAFVVLDRRMKEIVTAWQLRNGVVNDHGDPHYDAAVILRLGELHGEVEVWLAGIAAGLPRLAQYGVRLAAAAAAVAAGNGKYIASPRVDSYHGVWFELHEDLILLAGRTRAEETAAGRA